MNPGVVEETGKQVSGFMDVMRSQPLSLALVVMNFVLLGYLFYSGTATLNARKETVNLIVKWQQESDKLMTSCIGGDVAKAMMDSMQKITETMMADRNKEVNRMQAVIDKIEQRLAPSTPTPKTEE